MPQDEEGVGSLRYGKGERQKIAVSSRDFECKKCGKLVDHEAQINNRTQEKKDEDSRKSSMNVKQEEEAPKDEAVEKENFKNLLKKKMLEEEELEKTEDKRSLFALPNDKPQDQV